jgi:lipopolysaccharide export system permease protein
MKIYIQYISRYLAGSALIVAFSLTSIVWLTQALRFVDFIVNRGVSVLTFLKLTALIVPSLLFVILPLTLFVAVIFIYNRLLGDSELVVLQAAGMSRLQLAKPALLVGVATTLFAYFISCYALPVTYRQFKDMQSFLRDNYASLLLQEEVFNTPVEGLTVFVRERDAEGQLKGILVHDNSDQQRPVTMMAQRGQIQQTPKGPRFLLFQGNRQEVKDGRLSFLKFDSYSIDLSFYTTNVETRERRPEELFIPELFTRAASEPEKRPKYLAEAHQRLTWPLYNLGLALFAVVVMLTGQFNRRGNWQRITFASMASIAIIGMGMSLQNLVISSLAFIPVMYASIGGFLVICLWFLREHSFAAIPTAPPPEFVEMGK